MSSEWDKSRHIIGPYLQGSVLDIGSHGWPVVDHAIQVDLHKFHNPPHPPVQVVADAFKRLPFDDASFATVGSSHCLEDTRDWMPVLKEWSRLVVPDGHLLIQVPHRMRYRAAVAAGQPNNEAHKHEAELGELSEHMSQIGGFEPIMEQFVPESDYNILGIFKRA